MSAATIERLFVGSEVVPVAGPPKRFILRDEPFGFTLFDRLRLTHKFVKTTPVDSFERWTADLSSAPADIIYSPIRVYFELTRDCNLRCRTCFNSSGKPLPNELSTGEVKNVLDGLRSDNVIDLRFSGGEVTQRSDWFEILTHAKALGFAVSVNTNGVYEDVAATTDKLAALDLEQITFSIDGDREFHDYIRGRGNYDRTVASLERLHARGAHLRINTVLTKGSAKALETILDLAGQFAEEINFFYMRPTGRAVRILDQAISYGELVLFDKQIEALKSKYPHVNILHGSQVMQMNSVTYALSSEVGLRIGGPDGFTRFNILPDGSIWPGGYSPHLRPDLNLGNIKEEGYTLLNIWRNSPKLAEFRRFSLDVQKRCVVCPEKVVRCPGASVEMELYRELTPDKKNPYCIY